MCDTRTLCYQRKRIPLSTAKLILFTLIAAACASADDRHFANVYETKTESKGELDFENWVTWEARRGHGDNTNLWKFRQELEYGITQRLQLGIYLANWSLASDAGHHNSTRYESASAEMIYRLTNPDRDALGSAIYLEVDGEPGNITAVRVGGQAVTVISGTMRL